MLRTDLCDSIQFWVRQDGRIELSNALLPVPPEHGPSGKVGSHFPLNGTNLIARAAAALQELTGSTLGVSAIVHKRIPMEAGLGGGSSNAAVTLRALNKLWNLQLRESALHDIAASLGSDINFLLSGCRAAICRGRGEQVVGIPLTGKLHGVIAVPRTGNSTREVFAALERENERRQPADLIDSLLSGNPDRIGRHCFNRLQDPACDINPEIHQLLSQMKAAAGTGVLTGSGSACFSIVPTRRHALQIAKQVNTMLHIRCWTFQC